MTTHDTSGYDAPTLGDIEAIKQVKAKYFYFIDTKQWVPLRALFTADATFDPEGEGAYTFDGVDGFIAGASAGLAHAISVHHGHMPIIEVDGDEATAIWAMSDYVEMFDANGKPKRGFLGYGHYHERYRKDDGVWRMCSWKLTRLRVDELSPTR
jgi:hypothetical protein